MALLNDDDLAYLRETQAEVRPTTVDHHRARAAASDGMGGQTGGGWDDPVPIAVRITQVEDKASGDDVPQALADRFGLADLVQVTTDLTPMAPGDYLHDTARARWYVLVSYGEAQDWTTAQVVWAARASALGA